MDKRTEYTKKNIKETCLELLYKKDISKVTVSELCKKADINRATFYRYYLDIYDLLKQLQDEFISELKNSYKDYTSEKNNLHDYILAFLKTSLNNKKLVTILFYTNNSITFLDPVLEDAYLRFKEKWLKDGVKEKAIEHATVYIFNGTLGMVNYWIQSDFEEDIESLAQTIVDLSYHGANTFINKN